MSCCHEAYVLTEDRESVFSVDVSSISFGQGVLRELGSHARALGMTRVALFTDKTLRALPYVTQALESLRKRVWMLRCMTTFTSSPPTHRFSMQPSLHSVDPLMAMCRSEVALSSTPARPQTSMQPILRTFWPM